MLIKPKVQLYDTCRITLCGVHYDERGDELIIHKLSGSKNYCSNSFLNNFCLFSYCMTVKRSDPRFREFCIKFNFIEEVSDNNNDFIKFYEWYKVHGNTQKYALRKIINQKVIHIPEYTESNSSVNYYHIGRRSYCSHSSSDETVPAHDEIEITYLIKYVNNDPLEELDGYEKIKIDIFTYYKNVILCKLSEEIIKVKRNK